MRFIWALLDFSEDERKQFAGLILSLDQHLKRCEICFRASHSPVCAFCANNSKRDRSKIMVVEKDSDLITMEKSGVYNGLYHMTGGVVDALNENKIVRERIKALYERAKKPPVVAVPLLVKEGKGDVEIILALSPTKLGEFTASYIEKVLEPLNAPKSPVKLQITRLARGLSSGADLEYADETTLRHAIDNRK